MIKDSLIKKIQRAFVSMTGPNKPVNCYHCFYIQRVIEYSKKIMENLSSFIIESNDKIDNNAGEMAQ